MNRQLLTSLALVVTVCFPSAAFSQTSDKDAPSQKPQIRLSGSADAKKPAAQSEEAKAEASGSKAEAAGSAATPKEGEPAPSDPFEAEVLPETPESQVGSQPEPGLGPASAAPPRQPGADFPRPAGEPRVIDISADDEDSEDAAREPRRQREPKIRGSELPFTYHMNHIDVVGGFRVVGVHNDGLQPFLVDPVLVDTFIRAGGAFTIVDRFAFAANAEIGSAQSTANVRELDSQIDKLNFSLGLEGRYHFLHRMYAYARVAPGLEYVNASVGTRDTSLEMKDDHFGFQMDGALGTALRFAGSSDGRRRDPRLWGFVEGGFRYSTKHDLALELDSEDSPPRAQPLDLNPLHFSGGFFSFGLLMTF